MPNRVVEFRVFRLHRGRREEFATRFEAHLLPLHRRLGIELVSWGPSLHDQDSYFVIRVHPSVETRQEAMDSLFGSDEWLMNQEEEVLGMIESYNTCVVEACEPLIEAMRSGMMKAQEQDSAPPGWRQ